MRDIDEGLSREVTRAMNAAMPDVIAAAGRAKVASRLILAASSCASAVGLIAAIFATTLSSSPAVLTVVLVVFALLIGAMVVAAVVGLRAKRALKQLAETVEREWGATLVRVADRQVGVR